MLLLSELPRVLFITQSVLFTQNLKCRTNLPPLLLFRVNYGLSRNYSYE